MDGSGVGVGHSYIAQSVQVLRDAEAVVRGVAINSRSTVTSSQQSGVFVLINDTDDVAAVRARAPVRAQATEHIEL